MPNQNRKVKKKKSENDEQRKYWNGSSIINYVRLPI